VRLSIKWIPVDERTRFEAMVNETADMECGSTTVSLSRLKIVDFSSVVFAESTGVLVKSGRELFLFDNMAGKNIGVIAGTTNARAVRDQLARRNLSATIGASITDAYRQAGIYAGRRLLGRLVAKERTSAERRLHRA
jgi:ABC-type amino acid transport substrate-binding protein